MAGDRYLIVNADDFGLSAGVNHGILAGHERGIVTSASLMVRWPAAREAATSAKRYTGLSVGLHLDLGEWRYVSDAWVPIYHVIDVDDAGGVRREIARQLDSFRRLMGRDPSHLDSHQHVHRSDPVRSELLDVARALGVPVREQSPHVRYCGAFYGQEATGEPLPEAITPASLVAVLKTLPPGITELGCHPGIGTDTDSMYSREREDEVRTLCDRRVREVLAAEQICLCSFADCATFFGAD